MVSGVPVCEDLRNSEYSQLTANVVVSCGLRVCRKEFLINVLGQRKSATENSIAPRLEFEIALESVQVAACDNNVGFLDILFCLQAAMFSSGSSLDTFDGSYLNLASMSNNLTQPRRIRRREGFVDIPP